MMAIWQAIIAALLPVGAIRTGFVAPSGSKERVVLWAERGSRRRLQPTAVARPPPPSEDRNARGIGMSVPRSSPEETQETLGNVNAIGDRDAKSNRQFFGDRNSTTAAAAATSGSQRRCDGRRLLAIPPLALAAATACSEAALAAGSGGRIGGGYTPPPSAERTPSAPPMRQEQRYQAPRPQYQVPRAGRDIYGSDGSRFHIQFDGGRMRRRSTRVRFDPEAGEVPSSSITAGDVAMVGGVGAAVSAIQRYNRKRFLEDEQQGYGGRRSSTVTGRANLMNSLQEAMVTTLQLSLFCDREGGVGDILATLDNLSQTADVNSPQGLSTLINEVCLALLRAGRDWLGGTGSIKTYPPNGRPSDRDRKATPASRAKRDFNRAAMRERSKWERETVSNTPDRGFSSSTAPTWRGSSGQKDGTYAVVTLMVAWAGLRSTPPTAETRGRGWFRQDGRNRDDDRDVIFSVTNRKTALALLEWLGDEAAEGRGENVLDVEVLWTPADPQDSLDREDLDVKWPELRVL